MGRKEKNTLLSLTLCRHHHANIGGFFEVACGVDDVSLAW